MKKILLQIKNNEALCWVLGFQLFRFLLIPFVGLMPQDAYYYLYGQNLALSYYDHPGMIGYMLRFFSEIFGQSVYVIKLTDFTITSFTLLSFYKLSSLFLSKQRLWKSMVLITSSIFISILSFNSTPDVPLILFWTLSILCLYKAVFEEKKWYWILGGITMGLAFNSKYTALLLQFGIFLFLFFSNKYRKLLVSPWFWASFLISVAVTFPIWWWNYQNEFASFAFQSSDRISAIGKFIVKPTLFLGAIGIQMALLIPVLFYLLILLLFKYTKKVLLKFTLPSEKILFLLVFFIPTFVGFLIISPIYWIKLNWMMPSYITGIILAGIFINRRLLRIQMIISIIFHIAIATQVIFYFIPVKSDDTYVGWEELAKEIEALQKKYPKAFIFSADNYKTSAVLNFYLPEKVYAQNIVGLPALQFDYLGDDLSKLNSKNALFIDSDKRFKNSNKRGQILPLELKNHFKKIRELDPIIIKKGSREIRKFWVFYCEEYSFKKN